MATTNSILLEMLNKLKTIEGHTFRISSELDKYQSKQQTEPVMENITTQMLRLPQPSESHLTELGSKNQSDSTESLLLQITLSEKASAIIKTWGIRFNGQADSMPVDLFLYRVRSLTKQTLNGNFQLLLNHTHMLFTGPALDWYWRYHRSVGEFDWDVLSAALQERFPERLDDFNIQQLIYNRKQLPNESFDDFYDEIQRIADRLSKPLRDETMFDILCRNLRPDLQHISHVMNESVSELRDVIRAMENIAMTQQLREAAELENNDDFHDGDTGTESQPKQKKTTVICWNCRENGHLWQDCHYAPSVFCYGCGAPEIVKPKCNTCNKPKSRANMRR